MKIRVMDGTGDSTTVWEDPKQAEKLYARLKSKGFGAFRMEGAGKGTLIKAFDPEAETILMTPPLAGG